MSETPFEDKARALLEESTSRLDGRTLSRLTHARHAALAQAQKPPRGWWRMAVPAGAAAAVLAVVMAQRPGNGELAVDSEAVDMEIIADAEAPDFLEDGYDPEFYEWAAGELES
jgi:hypothetical protein